MQRLYSREESASALKLAQDKCKNLFDEVKKRGLIQAGLLESDLSDQIHALATELYGVKRHWHKRIVRAGINTLCTFRDNPEDRLLQENDIVYLDFGPVFSDPNTGDFEADYGEVFVLGQDARKQQLARDAWEIFYEGKAFYLKRPEMTGAELYAHVTKLAQARGWDFGGPSAGHIVGPFPHHEHLGRGDQHSIRPTNKTSMSAPAENGAFRHWILEIHLVDREQKIGAFVEDLLTC